MAYTNIYAPILDVGRDQRWGRYEEVYGESPYLVAELGISMVNGLQRDFQIASTAKHFAAYSNNKGGREGMSRVDPQMSIREVEYVHMYPWYRVIQESGLLGVMSSYNDYDGFPIQSSHYWLTERLRDQMGFKGYVVSDSDAVEYLYSKHKTAADMKEAVRQSVLAGLNVRCTFRSPDSYVLPLRDLVQEGSIDMAVIDERVADILRVKFLVGLFDQPYQHDLKAADDEVVQLYTRDVLSSVTTYEKNLCGFDRIHLQPNEEKEVTFTVKPEDLMLYNEGEEWVVEPGEFRGMIGASSEDIRLRKSFYVLGEGFDIRQIKERKSVVADPQTSTGMMVLDGDVETYWIGNKGYTLTFPLDNAKILNSIDIHWEKKTDKSAVFEIQISSGGGQFLTVFKGSPQDVKKADTVAFEDTTGTDLRIRIVSLC